MLPYFFNYYDQYVDKYIFFDDGSDDRTKEIIENHPKTEFRSLPLEDPDSYVRSAQHIHNSCWKESIGVADWVIITAVDEYLYHPSLIKYLNHCEQRGITVLPAVGFEMILDYFPPKKTPLLDSVKDGAPSKLMNKLSIFKPEALEKSNFQLGRHTAGPEGKIKYPSQDVLLNLHFKYLSFDFLFQRYKVLKEKLRKNDVENRWGYQYSLEKEELKKTWDTFKKHAVKNILHLSNKELKQLSPISERWWKIQIRQQSIYFKLKRKVLSIAKETFLKTSR